MEILDSPEGVFLGILGGGGVCRSVVQILALFQSKNWHFLHPFLDLGLVPRKMVKFNPGLSQILSKVFLYKNV